MDISNGKELSIIMEQIALLQQSTMSALLALGKMEKHAADLHFQTAKQAATNVKTMFDDLHRQIKEADSSRA